MPVNNVRNVSSRNNNLMKSFKWVEIPSKKTKGGIKQYDLHAREGTFGKFPGMQMFTPEYLRSIQKETYGYESPKGWERVGYVMTHGPKGRYYQDFTGRHFPKRGVGPESPMSKKIGTWQEKKGKMIDSFVRQYSKINPVKSARWGEAG